MIPKVGTKWMFRGNQQGCGSIQYVFMSSQNEVITWGSGWSWLGTPDLFKKLFTFEEEK
jgi:hypothetical protein